MTSTARDRGPDPLDNPRQFEAAWHAVARCFADGAEVAPTRSREFYQEIAFEVLRALAGEAEPDGSGPEEVWIPPSTDCMDHAHEPCPHCGSRIHHMRTDRCGTCGRRPVPAGGSAPADEVEEPAATCPLCARTVRLVLDVHGHLGPDVEAEDEVICDASHWRPSWAAERATDPDAKPWITVPPESAGGSAPHQGATTDVTDHDEPPSDTAGVVMFAARIASERWAAIPQAPIWDTFPDLATALFDLEAAATHHEGRGLSPAQEFHLAQLAEPDWKRRTRGVRTALFGTDAEVQAMQAGAPAEPGYQRIADAIEGALDTAALALDARRDGVPVEEPYLRLARVLDKAGLIDWAAFAGAPAEPTSDTALATVQHIWRTGVPEAKAALRTQPGRWPDLCDALDALARLSPPPPT